MIKSMTSFGRASLEAGKREYLVEIKTVNHKYNDITIRMDRNLSYLEDEIRKLVLKYISRGKVDINIEINRFKDENIEVKFNRNLIKAYIKELNEISTENNIINDISIMGLMSLPDVLKVKAVNTSEKDEVLECVEHALDNLYEMRAIEGNRIEQDIQKRLGSIERGIEIIEEKSDGLVEQYREKLKERISNLCGSSDVIDERLTQEIIIYADKTSIQEEITRLRSHCNQLRLTMSANKNSGKKMDFIIQEMSREANTIASKTNCLDVTNEIIRMKTEIENIREQVQNIE